MNANEERYRQKLEEVRRQLHNWADESRHGGWSTHQVEPQRQLASEIQQLLDYCVVSIVKDERP